MTPNDRTGLMITAFNLLLASVPTEQQRGEHGPLTLAEVDQSFALLQELGAESKAEREQRQDV